MDAEAMQIEWVQRSSLRPNPLNPRLNDDAVGPVADSIRRFGWKVPLVVRRDLQVVAGHTRLRAAEKLGHDRVPIVYFEGSDLEATAFGVADNKLASIALWDEPMLAKLLQELRAEDALEGIGFDDREIDKLLAEFDLDGRPAVDDAGAVEPPEIATTKTGDMWLLGEHRLLCGDSTKPDDMARLMGNEVATLLNSDPPYLISYDGSNHPNAHHAKAGRVPAPGKELGNRNWDEYVDPEVSLEFFTTWLRVALKHCIDRVPIYQWYASKRGALVDEAWKQNGLLAHQQIIWCKSRGVLTRSMFLWSHEPCVFGWREGFMPEKDRRPPPSERTTWEIDQAGEDATGLHPTMKPVAIFERPISWHTQPGEVVLEPFSGSGTQVVAAEKLGRRCRAMELSPPFVDAAALRWERATKQRATLDGDGRTFAEIAAERKP